MKSLPLQCKRRDLRVAVPSSVGDIKYRGPLGRILHSNRCHPLKIKVIFFSFFLSLFFQYVIVCVCGKAAIVTSVTIIASPLNFHWKEQGKNSLAPRLILHIINYYSNKMYGKQCVQIGFVRLKFLVSQTKCFCNRLGRADTAIKICVCECITTSN